MAADRWYELLLPVFALSFRMRFTGSSNPGFFHQGALSAWLRTVLGSPDDYGRYMCSDVPEQGKRRFSSGEEYRFTVFGIGGRGREYLARLPAATGKFCGDWDAAMPFRDNWKLQAVEHWATGEQIPHATLSSMDVPLALNGDMLDSEIAFWRRHPCITMQFHAPWRVLRSRRRRGAARGEMRYCRDSTDLQDDGVWLARVDDSLRRLA
ncbi:MAG: hypothetical protein Q9M29_09595, partial [Mariprofundaceae bacterium]|nr:hypothetical protein [Mariprofundaceae bacterium]